MRLIAIMAASVALVACSNSVPVKVTDTSAPVIQAQAVTPKIKGTWIDVRSPQEYAEGHLQGATNITVEDIADQIHTVQPNKDAQVNLYCRSGRRAEAARGILTQLGYTNVVNHGAFNDLAEKGYPVAHK
ncbi:rhodanese-like domain-containing protein [Moraxella nasovis]|uniref:rhodanese-like domain-containing protein n=1 Tax=Moraxella nasovis TaxID=2904121 RepID=UPI001F61B220|nr:rhodanese-like domain-containing protein [Moraxella nasovis]UNU74035.1 rhodanese-like domain-containing protein [Moraxella nasovis]